MIAFDDRELSNWFMALTEESSGDFLCSLSEAVMKADAEDYSVIRPALMDLKRKYTRLGHSTERITVPIGKKKRATDGERGRGLGT